MRSNCTHTIQLTCLMTLGSHLEIFNEKKDRKKKKKKILFNAVQGMS